MGSPTPDDVGQDFSRAWEPLPLFHVFCLQGVPTRGWIHDVAVWEPCAADLNFVIEAMGEPTGVRTSQSDGSKKNKGWVSFPPMTWRAEDHRQWTTRCAAMKHLESYSFFDMEAECPAWSEQERRRVNPQLSVKVTARLPTVYWEKQRGARQELVLALRAEGLLRVGEPRLVEALFRIAPRLGAFAVARARRRDLANLSVPGHPRQDADLTEGETAWSPVEGAPLVACRDDVETAPDSAGLGHRFIHPDGRSIDAGVMRGALQLSIRDPDGDVAVRRRAVADPEKALKEVVTEMQSDGFQIQD